MLSKTNANDEQTKSMHFLIKNDDLSKAYNTNWHKISADIKKIDSKPVYNTKSIIILKPK